MTDETRASDAERELAVARLREASAEGRLTLDELAARTDAAYAARTHGELVRVTADLPETNRQAPAAAGLRLAAGLFVPATLDLRRRAVAEVTVFALFAPVHVVVPADADVELEVIGVFAPVRDTRADAAPTRGARRIRVRGLALFAPVVVRHARS